MNWLIIVIIGHLVNAIAFILTKILLDRYVKNATVFAVLIGILGMAVFIFAPWGLVRPSIFELAINLAAGAILLAALLVFNFSLKKFEVSKVVPITGGCVPLFTFILAYVFLTERLGAYEVLAFIMLLIGIVIISFEKKAKAKFSWPLALSAGFAGLLFAISFVFTKYAYEIQPFVSSFIWIRAGSFVIAVIILLNPKYARLTWQMLKQTSLKIKALFAVSLIFGALGFVLVNYGINLGSVTLVNALQGIQYAFLIILIILATKFFPKIIKEKIHGWLLAQKIIGIVFVSLGIVFLAI